MKPIFSIVDEVLWIGDQPIDTRFPVAQVIQVRGKVIVRFDPDAKGVKNNNVACYGRRGNLLWTIQESPHRVVEDNPYMYIQSNDKDVVASCWIGVDYQVNFRDGTVTTIAFSK